MTQPPIRITCLTESVSRLGGGLFDAERRMQQAVQQSSRQFEIEVVGMHDSRTDEDLQLWQPIKACSIQTSRFPPGLGYSNEFETHLGDSRPDVVYSIGLWKYFSRACLRWHRKTGGPYVIAPHGMLDPWALRNHKLRKKIVLALYQRRHLEGAVCIRALNEAELAAIRNLGLTNPVALVPNGVDLPARKERQLNSQTILFLGRLHPKKGIDLLLEAWRQFTIDNPDYRLQIAGWGDGDYPDRVSSMVAQFGLSGSVELSGPLFGSDKENAFRNASAFILPSHSEGMPMAILEAWSYELPVILTPQCNMPEGSSRAACIECQPETTSILSALNRFAGTSLPERQSMGSNGRNLVEEKFTWNKVASDMAATYRWVSGNGPCPEFVCMTPTGNTPFKMRQL
ncbi:MAG: glycosyltransferase [Planctomycetota bacterium]